MAVSLLSASNDLDRINQVINEALEKVSYAFDHAKENVIIDSAVSPHLISRALKQFLEVLHRVELEQYLNKHKNGAAQFHAEFFAFDGSDEIITITEISELGEHGLQLLDTLGEWAQALNLPFQQNQIKTIMVMVALWIVRHGGQLNSLNSIVNALAEIANTTSERDALADLSYLMGELISAVSAETKFDFENQDRHQPWRVLNLNRGIIATRSHDPQIMEHAFDELIRNIPEDAGMFFEQGIRQMDEMNYPDHVRNVMLRYYEEFRTRTLH